MKKLIILITLLASLLTLAHADTRVSVGVGVHRSWGSAQVSYTSHQRTHYVHHRPAVYVTRACYQPRTVYVVPESRPVVVYTQRAHRQRRCEDPDVIYVANYPGGAHRRVVAVYGQVNAFTDPPRVIRVCR